MRLLLLRVSMVIVRLRREARGARFVASGMGTCVLSPANSFRFAGRAERRAGGGTAGDTWTNEYWVTQHTDGSK